MVATRIRFIDVNVEKNIQLILKFYKLLGFGNFYITKCYLTTPLSKK